MFFLVFILNNCQIVKTGNSDKKSIINIETTFFDKSEVVTIVVNKDTVWNNLIPSNPQTGLATVGEINLKNKNNIIEILCLCQGEKIYIKNKFKKFNYIYIRRYSKINIVFTNKEIEGYL